MTFRSDVLNSLDGAPLVHAAARLMTLSVAACCVLAVLSLLFGLALGAANGSRQWRGSPSWVSGVISRSCC